MPGREMCAGCHWWLAHQCSVLGRGEHWWASHQWHPRPVGRASEAPTYPVPLQQTPQRPVALQGADGVPTLTMDVFQEFFRGIPTVELDVDGPARGQQWFQRLQDVPGQMELAAKVDSVLGGTMAIEPPHRLVPQI